MHDDLSSNAFTFLKATCTDEYVSEYRPSLLTKTETIYVIKDTLSYSKAVQDKILELPEISVDRLADHTIYPENNSGTLPSELYLSTLFDLADILFAEYQATANYKANCGSNVATCKNFLIENVVQRLWRRPLNKAELANFTTLFGRNLTLTLKANHLFTAALTSPQFYMKNYLPLEGSSDIKNFEQYQLASRISFFLYNSIPDRELWEAAIRGQLISRSDIERHVDRILQTPGYANRFVMYTLAPWAGLDRDLSSKILVTNDRGVSLSVSTLVNQPYTQLYNMVLKNAPLEHFVYGPNVTMNSGIASFLGLSTAGLTQDMTTLPSTEKMIGSYFVSPYFAYSTKSADPSKTMVSKRGIAIAEDFLCTPIAPNELRPEDILKVIKGANNEIEVGEKRRNHPSCIGCHGEVDKMGMGLEYIDAFGRVRAQYSNKTPISIYLFVHPRDTRAAVDLPTFLNSLSKDERFHACFIKTIANKVVPFPIEAQQGCINDLTKQNLGSGIRDYVKTLVSSKIFTQVRSSK